MSTKTKELTFFQCLSLDLGILLFKLLSLTLRVRLTPRAKQEFEKRPRGHLFILWHNRLAMGVIAFSTLKGRLPMTALVSASSDGCILARIMKAFGMQTARGSSSKRAVEATRGLLDALGEGQNIAITPDGPRGPKYKMKQGAAVIGQNYAKGTFVAGLSASAFWRFHSWDGFILPKPFSKITFDLIRQENAMTNESIELALLANNP